MKYKYILCACMYVCIHIHTCKHTHPSLFFDNNFIQVMQFIYFKSKVTTFCLGKILILSPEWKGLEMCWVCFIWGGGCQFFCF